jgi:WD40 repeat protein
VALDDGTALAVTASLDGSVRVWDLARGSCRYVFAGRFAPVGGLLCARLADGSAVAAITGADRALRVWNLNDGSVRHVIAKYLDAGSPLGFARLPGGAEVAVTRSRGDLIQLWRLADGTHYRLGGLADRRMGDGLRHHGEEVAVRLLHQRPTDLTRTAGPPHLLHLSPYGIRQVDLDGPVGTDQLIAGGQDPTGSWAATLGERSLQVWDLRDGRLRAELPGLTGGPAGRSAVPVLAVVPGAAGVLAAVYADRLYLWRLPAADAAGASVETISLPGTGTALAAAPDGSLLVAFGADLCRLAATPGHETA